MTNMESFFPLIIFFGLGLLTDGKQNNEFSHLLDVHFSIVKGLNFKQKSIYEGYDLIWPLYWTLFCNAINCGAHPK